MSEAILAALESELHGYEMRKLPDRAALVKAEIARVRKTLKSAGEVETAAVAPPESTGVTTGRKRVAKKR